MNTTTLNAYVYMLILSNGFSYVVNNFEQIRSDYYNNKEVNQ
jgi:hypothetical protein